MDTRYTVYQAGSAIVTELANRDRIFYSKDATGNHVGARLKDDPGLKKWLDYRALSAKEDITSGILSQTIYECDNSDSSCNSELSECSEKDLSRRNSSCTSYNYGTSYDKL